jgi:hypothetical protein
MIKQSLVYDLNEKHWYCVKALSAYWMEERYSEVKFQFFTEHIKYGEFNVEGCYVVEMMQLENDLIKDPQYLIFRAWSVDAQVWLGFL